MLVCKLPLYHIIMRCLGYQQISRRLGREGCSTIRKCQLAASSFCRSLNPIFLTCISATGTGPLHSDKPPGEPQQEHCDGDPTALLSQCPQTPAGPQAELQPSHRPAHGALCGAAGLGGLCAVTPAQTPTQLGNREHLLGHQACACVHVCVCARWGRTEKAAKPGRDDAPGGCRVHCGVTPGTRGVIAGYLLQGAQAAPWG